jgi:hypothetical protein
MAFDLYKYAMAAITAALVSLWSFQSSWRAMELLALVLLVFPLYIPLLYRFGTWIWVLRRRRRLGLPMASDRDIIDFIGEELDRCGVAWQWRVALRRTSNWDALDVGEDDEDPVFVRVRNGLIEVSSDEGGAVRFVDPVAAVDRILEIYDGASKPDDAVFVDTDEPDIQIL